MPRILVVDDEPGIRSLLTIAFTRGGYEVQTAQDGETAVEICAHQTFDAILSDVHMPGIDGHTLMQRIAKDHPTMRSILMSAVDLKCGCCPYAGHCILLRKPFHPKDVVALMTGLLQSN